MAILVPGPWQTTTPVHWDDQPLPASDTQVDPDYPGSIGGSTFSASIPAGGYPTGVVLPSTWTDEDLRTFYANSIQNPVGGAQGFVQGLWTLDYRVWPYTRSVDNAFFWEYDYVGTNYVGGHTARLPSLKAFRAKAEVDLTNAERVRQQSLPYDPNRFGFNFEWQDPNDYGSLVSATLHLVERLGESIHRPRDPLEPPYYTGPPSGTSVRLLNPVHLGADGSPNIDPTPAMLGFDYEAATTGDVAGDLDGHANFNWPVAHTGPLGPGESRATSYPLDLATLAGYMVDVPGAAGKDYTDPRLGVQQFVATTAAAENSEYPFPGSGPFTTDGTDVRTKVIGHVWVEVEYQPPPFRFVQGYGSNPVPVVVPSWVRALQRADGLGAGAPPRAVQQASKATSIRQGPNALD